MPKEGDNKSSWDELPREIQREKESLFSQSLILYEEKRKKIIAAEGYRADVRRGARNIIFQRPQRPQNPEWHERRTKQQLK
jgi:hypothetical protein